MKGRRWGRLRLGLGWLCGLLFALHSGFGLAAQKAPSVVFINPGHAGESFWSDVNQFIQAAAERLQIELEILHAERHRNSLVKMAKRIAQRAQHPDYLLIVNEKGSATPMLHMLENSGIKVFFLLNDLSSGDKQRLQSTPYWSQHLIGSLIPDNAYIGYQTAQEMYRQAKGHIRTQPPHSVIFVSGDRQTPASQMREQGANAFVSESPYLLRVQTVYGQWREDTAYKQVRTLLTRRDDIDFIWTANDLMAFGAMRALQERGLEAGRDVFIATTNTSQKVLKARAAGHISALGGGHFMAGGWSLVVLKDHFNGYPIPEHLTPRLFTLIHPNSDFMHTLISKDWQSIDFDAYSLRHRARQDPAYDFSQLHIRR